MSKEVLEVRNPSQVKVYLLWEIISVITMEATEVEQTGLTKVNTFKTRRFIISIQTTPNNMCFTNNRNRYISRREDRLAKSAL